MAAVKKMVCVCDYEEEAFKILPRNALDYYRSGADEEVTLRLNRDAFNRLRIRPRVLRDVSSCDLSTTVFGKTVGIPFGVSPTAMQRMAHSDGEVATVRGVSSHRGVFILSTLSTTSLEDIGRAAPDCVRWFQLYIYKDRKVTEDLVRRAERAGFSGLAVTVDAPQFGNRRADIRNKFQLPPHLTLANFSDSIKSTSITTAKKGSALNEYVDQLFDQTVTWEDISWLKRITSLPVALKGILTAEDARLAVDVGADAIFVSNHGARQVDCSPAAIEALPEIKAAVQNRCHVFFDGGVRQGTDIFKALALGADMVFVGRPALWGLACSGEEGVKDVLNILKTELQRTMALTVRRRKTEVRTDQGNLPKMKNLNATLENNLTFLDLSLLDGHVLMCQGCWGTESLKVKTTMFIYDAKVIFGIIFSVVYCFQPDRSTGVVSSLFPTDDEIFLAVGISVKTKYCPWKMHATVILALLKH